MDRGQRYVFARKRANVSNAEVAEAVGVSRQSTHKWETAGVPVASIQKVAKVLECSAAWLSGDDSRTDDAASAVEKALAGHDSVRVASIANFTRMVLGVAP